MNKTLSRCPLPANEILFQSHARIDDRVEKVRDQISKKDERGHDEIEGNERWIIPLQHGLVTQTPHARIGKDGFNDHRTADERGEKSSDTSDEWTNGISEGVFVKNRILIESLGACGAHIAFTQGFEHAGSDKA